MPAKELLIQIYLSAPKLAFYHYSFVIPETTMAGFLPAIATRGIPYRIYGTGNRRNVLNEAGIDLKISNDFRLSNVLNHQRPLLPS